MITYSNCDGDFIVLDDNTPIGTVARTGEGWVGLYKGAVVVTGKGKAAAAKALVAYVDEATYDEVGLIMAYEQGEISECKALLLFQHLVNSGLAWRLQGHYGRTADNLLKRGLIKRPKVAKQ